MAADDDKKDDTKEENPWSVSGAGSLLDTATYNLDIAQQYIDEAKYLIEHRLICFHYGIALLARDRDDPDKRAKAKQYLQTAANWSIPSDAPPQLIEVYRRIAAEAFYNLGVIEELDQHFDLAHAKYCRSLEIARPGDGTFEGLRTLCDFGKIATGVARFKRNQVLHPLPRTKKTQEQIGKQREKLKQEVDALRARLPKGSPSVRTEKLKYVEDETEPLRKASERSAAPHDVSLAAEGVNPILQSIRLKLEAFAKTIESEPPPAPETTDVWSA